MLSYIIVGSGYRAEYFGRIAQTYPGLFRALYLCRSEEKAALMKRHVAPTAGLCRPIILDDVCLNAKGYERLAAGVLRGNGNA